MRLSRPYVPKAIRVKVAERQFFERFGERPKRGASYFMDGTVKGSEVDGVWLRALLLRLFDDQKVHLHHRPALCNRKQIWHYKRDEFSHYEPDANDPDFLVYLPVDEHDVETRVRGQHGQYSDLALRRKRKRIERKAKRRKTRWPSRPLRSRNDLRRER